MANRKSSQSFITTALMLAAGIVMGYFIRPMIHPEERLAAAAAQDPEPNTGDAYGGNVVAILEKTIRNMELETGKFEARNYSEPLLIPGEIIEKLPDAHQVIVAPVGGRVEKVHVTSGQAVSPGEALFDIRVTDEQLAKAQVELLSVIAESKTIQNRLDRVRPLVSSGAVADRRIQELELELEKLNAGKGALVQELEMRGLSVDQLNQVLDGERLLQTVTIRAPELSSLNDQSESAFFTVESISGVPGKSVSMGVPLCELNHHGTMLIKGMAFEADLKQISNAGSEGKLLAARFGDHPDTTRVDGLSLLSIDNSVDEQSQTYPVFVELKNGVVGQSNDASGRHYIQWKYKPGQRCHLEVPVREWKDVVVIPAGALIQEGPESFVFMKLNHSHGGDEPVVEFQKVLVKVLYRNRDHAVLEKQTSLDLYENYVLGQAFQIHLALKQSASSGDAPSHGHAHD